MIKKYTFLKSASCIFGLFCLTFLGCLNAQGQTLNFTIDTAVDNGTSITETLMDGADTYVLTVLHSTDEELDDLGGGDKIFYLSTGGATALQPFVITLTKNATSTNFTLNGMDYDTLGAGNISVENQSNDVIAADKNYAVGAGAITITSIPNATDISSFKIIPATISELNDFGFHNINVDIVNPLSIESEVLKNTIAIHPNPTKGEFFNLKNDKQLNINNIAIYDLTGKIVLNESINNSAINNRISLSGINSGIYLVKISDENNNSVTKKLIIQ